MAAIDRLYLKNYQEFVELKMWARKCLPEMLDHFYDVDKTFNGYFEEKERWLRKTEEHIKRGHKRLGEYTTREEAIENLRRHYKESADYDAPQNQLEDEVDYCVELMKKMYDGTLEDEYTFPACNLPFELDKKLKWKCPLPFVRDYLHKQCGVNSKWEWFYRLFWKYV